MKKLVNIALAAALASIIGGCAKTKVATPQAIVPLYATIDSVADMDSVQVRRFMETDSAELRAMFEVLGCDSLSYDEVMAWSNSLPVSIFTPAVDSVYPTLAPLEQSLGCILANAETDSLHLPSRTYVAVVWGKRYPIIFNGDNMLIALNHYLGSEYDGYEHWPAYARLDKTPERLPYDIAEALVGNEYPYQGGDAPTVLSRMIYEGVLAYAKMQLVPESDITQALGYNEQQLDWLDEHEAEIWQKLVADNLLYDTSETTAERLVSPAPNTSLISTYTPGRAGRYIGYRILLSLRRNGSRLSLREMLKPEFYNSKDILKESGYNPK